MKKLTIALFIFMNIVIAFSQEQEEKKTYSFIEKTQLKQLLSNVMELINSQYVSQDDVDFEKLTHGAIKGMLKTLEDPYSRFMEPKTYKEMKVDTKGEFGGLGIVISVKEDILTIISPIEDTPAYEAGVEAGDQIIKIDGEACEGISVEEAVNKLRGPKGTKVTITIRRILEVKNGKTKQKILIKDYTITRDTIKITSVKKKMLGDDIGHIRITNFTSTVTDDLEKALLEFEKKGVKGLILDLRNNPGGLLTTAVDVASKFLGKADIVTVKNRENQVKTYKSYVKEHPNTPMVVLINEGSASASEIVSGAIQDNKRGIVIGKKSFGKGCVQTVIPLQGGRSAIALTTAWYYTPSGACIHNRGITPDIEVSLPKLSAAEAEKLIKKYQKEREDEYKNNNKSSKKKDKKIDKKKKNKKKDEKEKLKKKKDKKKKKLIRNLDGSLPIEKKEKEYKADEYDTQLIRAIDVLRGIILFNKK